MPMPEITRPTISGVSEVPNPIISRPTTLPSTPAMMRTRARPRSARGAIRIWAKKALRNPAPMSMPMLVSLMPYSSR